MEQRCLGPEGRATHDITLFPDSIHTPPDMLVVLCMQGSQAFTEDFQQGFGVLETGVWGGERTQPTRPLGQAIAGTAIGIGSHVPQLVYPPDR